MDSPSLRVIFKGWASSEDYKDISPASPPVGMVLTDGNLAAPRQGARFFRSVSDHAGQFANSMPFPLQLILRKMLIVSSTRLICCTNLILKLQEDVVVHGEASPSSFLPLPSGWWFGRCRGSVSARGLTRRLR